MNIARNISAIVAGAATLLGGFQALARSDIPPTPPGDLGGMVSTMWERITDAAEQHNVPGHFTALIGYEWTSTPGGSNLHRNVIFRDDKTMADQIVPMSVYDSQDPEDLGQWMTDYESLTGGRVLAIAHGGNLSNGLMFDNVTFTSQEPLDRDHAERRIRWEPLYEVTQIKGTVRRTQ